MFVEFKPWHLDMLRLTVPGFDADKSPVTLTWLAARGLVYTVVADEGDEVRILGVAGVAPVTAQGDFAEAFVIGSENMKTHRVAFVKTLLRLLDAARQRFAKIEAVADEGIPAQWFRLLGFEDIGGGRWRLAASGRTC
jgi:hypothetical protein